MEFRTCLRIVASHLGEVAARMVGCQEQHIWLDEIDKPSQYSSGGCTSASIRFVSELKQKLLPDLLIISPTSESEFSTIMEVFSSMLASCRHDGGWFCLLMSSRLIVRAIDSRLHGKDCSRGFHVSCQRTKDLIRKPVESADGLSFRMRWSDSVGLKAVVKAVLVTKSSLALTTRDLSHLIVLVIEVFVHSILSQPDFSFQRVPQIHYIESVGSQPSSSRWLPNSVILDIPLPSFFPARGLVDVVVTVFDSSLEFPQFTSNDFSSLELQPEHLHPTTHKSLKSIERQVLERFVRCLLLSGVRVLMCQKRIHPYLQLRCHQAGVVCIQRLSSKYIGAMLRLSGAKSMGEFNFHDGGEDCMPLPACSLGFLSALTVQRFSGQTRIVACGLDASIHQTTLLKACYLRAVDSQCQLQSTSQGDEFASGVAQRRRSMHTVVVCGATLSLCQELQRVLDTCFLSLANLIDDPVVVPGGGIWQFHVSQALKTQCKAIFERNEFTLRQRLCRFDLVVRTQTESPGTESALLVDLLPPQPSDSQKSHDSVEVRLAEDVFSDALADCAYAICSRAMRAHSQSSFTSVRGDDFIQLKNGCGVQVCGELVVNRDSEPQHQEFHLISADALDCVVSCEKQVELASNIAACLLGIGSSIVAKPRTVASY